jgi:hypothetical protein
MVLRALQWFLPITLLLSASFAHAQPAPGAVSTAPASSASAAVPLQYFSIFDRYQPFKDQPLLPWREANDAVEKIGGWRFYAKEAQQTIPAGKPDEQPAGPDPHSGHGGKP